MSRDLNQNLYAEEIINESPYYYDDHGRLRMRMLMEAEPMMKPEEKKPEDEKKEPSPEAKKAETPAPAPAPEKKADGAAATTEKPPLSSLLRGREKMRDEISKGKPGGGSNINKKPVRPYMPPKKDRPALPPDRVGGPKPRPIGGRTDKERDERNRELYLRNVPKDPAVRERMRETMKRWKERRAAGWVPPAEPK